MGLELGIAFAFGALVAWGIGDFLIQRTTRKVGDWETLFVVTAFGVLLLSPFVYKDFATLISFEDNTFFILLALSVVILMAALLDFEALRKGKLAVVEPVLALEVPVTAFIAFILIREAIDMLQVFFVALLLIGIVLVSLKSHHLVRKKWLERGVLLAVVGAVFMGAANFLVGFASRITNPLLTNWFLNVFLMLISLFYLMTNRRTRKLVRDFSLNRKLLLTMSVFDNAAWIFIAFAATIIPITIAFAISESYVVISALLGLIVNRELLMHHQKLGIALALSGSVALSIVTI
ncbi:MAG: DMT family transporter [Candidatus Aenigmarchaeota archaeon]|nr:DMT family transporter [Candidatus Aenigmarchaeota archaeon]